MKKESEQKINNLISNLEESNKQPPILKVDPMLTLKNTTTEFILARFNKLRKEETFQEIIEQAITNKIITNPGEIKIHDLMTLLNQTRSRNTEAIESLLHFFKPSQGEKSPLLDDLKEREVSPEESILSSTDSKVLQTLNKLSKIVEQSQKQTNKEDS